MKKENLREQIRRMEQELLSEEFWEEPEAAGDFEEEELGPGYNYAVDFDRTLFADEEPDSRREEKPGKNSNIRGLKYLLLLEILGILALIGWWIRWLI